MATKTYRPLLHGLPLAGFTIKRPSPDAAPDSFTIELIRPDGERLAVVLDDSSKHDLSAIANFFTGNAACDAA